MMGNPAWDMFTEPTGDDREALDDSAIANPPVWRVAEREHNILFSEEGHEVVQHSIRYDNGSGEHDAGLLLDLRSIRPLFEEPQSYLQEAWEQQEPGGELVQDESWICTTKVYMIIPLGLLDSMDQYRRISHLPRFVQCSDSLMLPFKRRPCLHMSVRSWRGPSRCIITLLT